MAEAQSKILQEAFEMEYHTPYDAEDLPTLLFYNNYIARCMRNGFLRWVTPILEDPVKTYTEFPELTKHTKAIMECMTIAHDSSALDTLEETALNMTNGDELEAASGKVGMVTSLAFDMYNKLSPVLMDHYTSNQGPSGRILGMTTELIQICREAHRDLITWVDWLQKKNSENEAKEG